MPTEGPKTSKQFYLLSGQSFIFAMASLSRVSTVLLI